MIGLALCDEDPEDCLRPRTVFLEARNEPPATVVGATAPVRSDFLERFLKTNSCGHLV